MGRGTHDLFGFLHVEILAVFCDAWGGGDFCGPLAVVEENVIGIAGVDMGQTGIGGGGSAGGAQVMGTQTVGGLPA